MGGAGDYIHHPTTQVKCIHSVTVMCYHNIVRHGVVVFKSKGFGEEQLE